MSHPRTLKLPLEMWQKIPIIPYLYAKIIHRTPLKSLSIPGETQLACFSQLFDNEPIGKSLQHLEMEKKELESAWFLPNFLRFVFLPPHTFLAPIDLLFMYTTSLVGPKLKKKPSIFCYLTVIYTMFDFKQFYPQFKKFAICLLWKT